jgi:hypothetical protein
LQSRGTTTNTRHTKHGNKHAAQSQHKDSTITSTNRPNHTNMCSFNPQTKGEEASVLLSLTDPKYFNHLTQYSVKINTF